MSDRGDIEKMDALFRHTDFAAENPDLGARLWCRIMQSARDEEDADERALEDGELYGMAAAGTRFSAQAETLCKKW